jgi:hypothetical protein
VGAFARRRRGLSQPSLLRRPWRPLRRPRLLRLLRSKLRCGFLGVALLLRLALLVLVLLFLEVFLLPRDQFLALLRLGFARCDLVSR